MRSNSTESRSQDTSSISPTQAEGATKRKDVAERTNVSAAVRKPQTKQDSRKAPKGASEKRRDVTVDSDQPRRKKQHDTEISSDARTRSGTSVGHQGQKVSTAMVPRPLVLPLVSVAKYARCSTQLSSERLLHVCGLGRLKDPQQCIARLWDWRLFPFDISCPLVAFDDGERNRDLLGFFDSAVHAGGARQSSKPHQPLWPLFRYDKDNCAETTKAIRKSSKISLGGRSTASGRQQASTLNASRKEGRVSRTASKVSLRGPGKPPRDPLEPAASHSTVALTQAALVSALPQPAKTSKSDKDLSRTRPAIQFLGHPKGETTPKSSKTQLAQPKARSGEKPARRQKSFTGAATAAPPDASRTSRASRTSLKRSVSEKAPTPTNRDSRASLASASRRSVASTASRRTRSSTGAREGSGGSKSSRRHRRSQRDFRIAELGGERDHSLASVVSLAGDSRASVASSKRSLRPIGPEEEVRPKRRVLQMPDGTYVGLSQKNRWLRAMHEKYLGWDYMACTMKTAFGMMLLGFIYILMFRQDILLQVAIFVRENVFDPDSTAGTKYKRKHGSTTTAGSYSTVPGARIAPKATEVARQNIRGSHGRTTNDSRHR